MACKAANGDPSAPPPPPPSNTSASTVRRILSRSVPAPRAGYACVRIVVYLRVLGGMCEREFKVYICMQRGCVGGLVARVF